MNRRFYFNSEFFGQVLDKNFNFNFNVLRIVFKNCVSVLIVCRLKIFASVYQHPPYFCKDTDLVAKNNETSSPSFHYVLFLNNLSRKIIKNRSTQLYDCQCRLNSVRCIGVFFFQSESWLFSVKGIR